MHNNKGWALSFLFLAGTSFAATADFTWTKDNTFYGSGAEYNDKQHEYRSWYVNKTKYSGFLDGCISDVSDFSAPQYQWVIEKYVNATAVPQTMGLGGHLVLIPYWKSEWVTVCKYLAAEAGFGTVFGGETVVDTPPERPVGNGGSFAVPPGTQVGERQVVQSEPPQQADSPPRESPVFERRTAQGSFAGRPDMEILGGGRLGLDGVDGGPRIPDLPPVEGPQQPNPVLVGMAFDEGEYLVTLRIRDGSGGSEVETAGNISVHELTVALVGDSYISGEGNPDYHGQVAPIEGPAGKGLGAIAGVMGGGPFVKAGVEGLFANSQVQVGPNDLVCKFTRGVGYWLKDRSTLGYDAVHVTDDRERYGLDMLSRPSWLDLSANRSNQSGHALAAMQVGFELQAATGWTVRVFNFATSGAKTVNLLREPQNFFQAVSELPTGSKGQIDELIHTLGDQHIDALVMSIGGNDAGFADFLQLATLEILTDIDLDPATGDVTFFVASHEPDFLERLSRLRISYGLIDQKIRENLNVDKIILTGYPEDIFSSKNGGTDKGCGIFDRDFLPTSGVSRTEALIFKKWAGMVRDLQVEMAEELGWEFIDVAPGFQGHGYCAGGGNPVLTECDSGTATFYRSAERSCVIQGNLSGTMHPNACGHQVYKNRLLPILRGALIPRPTELDQSFRFDAE